MAPCPPSVLMSLRIRSNMTPFTFLLYGSCRLQPFGCRLKETLMPPLQPLPVVANPSTALQTPAGAPVRRSLFKTPGEGETPLTWYLPDARDTRVVAGAARGPGGVR